MSLIAGGEAENLALTHLAAHDLKLIARNYRCRQGEIDLIMRHGDSLVFVEVRFRQHSHYGSALESVDRGKQARLLHTARHYLQHHPQYASLACRFDVVGISGDQGRIEWITNAFGE